MNDVARPRNDDDAAHRRSPPDVLRRLRFGCHVTTRHSLLDERQHTSSVTNSPRHAQSSPSAS
ncbi:hypothetical protein K443DRAFT_8077 [Laccaria amethystina LaAM-08-1]|uniref:Uncharacterized protein n=1 Tax=Laccaria amethystina LaAM-08-1 TaxID=1095629 RepID=A0A0C9XV73_9AGAR|nr:hypothetical protein K443DRAFT_8077 [Laccaria amethystina LaAM-08-1]